MKKAKIWYVIADGGRARFVERDERGAFRTVTSFVSTELHAKSSDLGRDRPSRVMESASPGRSAVEPRRDLKEAAKEDFIKLVAEQIDSEHGRRAIRQSGAGRAPWGVDRTQAQFEQADGGACGR